MISGVIKTMRKYKAFTLIEMLVVMAIIGILAGMMIVGMEVARKKARVSKAKAECRQLVQAWKSYWLVYGKWPDACEGKTNAPMDSTTMRILMGLNAGANPKMLKFMEPNDNVSASGFKDPWDNLYQVDFSKTKKFSGSEAYQTTVFLPNKNRYNFDD